MRAIRVVLQFSLLSVCSLVPNLHAQADGQHPLTIDDIMAIKSVGDHQISPDGRWVAYTVTEKDLEEDKSRTQIWMVSIDGGEAIPMTSPESSARRPRWTPDNKYLSFTASRGEDAKTQVWRLNRLGGDAVQITDVKQGVSGYAWSPDGSRLLLEIEDMTPEEMTEDTEDDDRPKPHVIDRIQFKRDYAGYLDRRRTHIYTYTPGEDAPVQVTFGDYEDEDPVWSPDGQSIAFVSDRSEEPDLHYGSNIWRVDLAGDEPKMSKVTDSEGRERSPTWSPDGKRIAYVTTTGPDVGGSALTPTQYLAVTPADKYERRLLTADLDRNVSDPQYSADGKRILFRLEDSGQVHFASVASNGTGLKRELDGPVTVRDIEVAAGRTVVRVEQANRPSEIYAYDDGVITSLTDVNGGVFDEVMPANVEKQAFRSADGTTVEAFFVRPPDFEAGKLYPTILWLHGGPAAQFSYSFRDNAHLFAANGYVVIMPNPRGSVGYGEAFAKGTVAAWGEKDVQDVLAAVDHGIEMGIVDPERLGVGGWSYGGILTNYVITQSTRFKAASSGASLGLVPANYGHDQYQLMYELEFGLPWENRERWDALSPFWKVEDITTPTQWMGGAVDWNVPIINSEQMYLAMKRLGKETQLVVYPDEHHGIRRPSFQKDRLERWVAWFDHYLK
ncbi:S9 family peptidase [Congregibacter brevis]|uniref:S9 family peptidase n=1 Tax=Congregibacter brevis TaxID=3081201 RepID=A0ABZ0IEK7_9GAMM|nr:S9 family peptidase [Congregibacter sp. IMCC45268]